MSVGAESARELGRYAVLDEIAAGGMATVHLGRVLEGAAVSGGPVEFVAIKKMHAQFSRDPDFRSMFLDEAKLVRRIEHENVVRTLDVVDGDELLLVMELIEGESLSRLAKQTAQRGARIPRGIVSRVMQDMLRGLHAAHEATNEAGEPLAIVHRDVSPHNVIVGTDGVARVLDFGVAKARGRMQQTQQGQIKGKLAYMSPEQARGKAVDRRSDIFASGIVLWELLVGARLFDGENEASVLTQLLVDKPPAPSSRHADLAPFDALVEKALETNPDARFPTTLAFADAIAEAIPSATRAEVEAWVKSEAKDGIERRSNIRALRARERRLPGEPAIPRDTSGDVREGTPSGISRSGANAAVANKSGVSFVSNAGPRPTSGLRFGGGGPAPRPLPPKPTPPIPAPSPSRPQAAPPPLAEAAAAPTPIAPMEEPSTTGGVLNEKTPPMDASKVGAAPASPGPRPLEVPAAPTFGVSSSAMMAVPHAPAPPSYAPASHPPAPPMSSPGMSGPPSYDPQRMSAPSMSLSGGWQGAAPYAQTAPAPSPGAHAYPTGPAAGTTTRLAPIAPGPVSQPPVSRYGQPAAAQTGPVAAADGAPPPLAPERVRRLMLIAGATAVLVALALAAILVIATSGGDAKPAGTSSAAPPPSAPSGKPTARPGDATTAAPRVDDKAAPVSAPPTATSPAGPSASAAPSAAPSASSETKLVPIPTASGKKKKPDVYGF